MQRVHRFLDAQSLVSEVAGALARNVANIQSQGRRINLALSGGQTLNQIYAAFAELAKNSAIRPSDIELWWACDRYVPTTDPNRSSTQALSRLAGAVSIVPSQTHPMPTPSVGSDPSHAASVYAQELGDTQIDICLVGLGSDGHIADIYPGDELSLNSSATVIGVANAPSEPHERITMSLSAINNANQVWVIASGYSKADALRDALSKDSSLPAALLDAKESTHWLADARACSKLDYYRCELFC